MMPVICNSISVVPYGPDMIETWHTCCFFLPPLVCGPVAEGAVRMRKPGTNTFDRMYFGMMPVTFSADGTAKIGEKVYKKRPHSQKRTFQKVCEGPRGQMVRLLLQSVSAALAVFALFLHYEEGAQRGPVRGVGPQWFFVDSVLAVDSR